MPTAWRQLLNFLIFLPVVRGTLNLHSPPNAVLVAMIHQRWWFSAKRRGDNRPANPAMGKCSDQQPMFQQMDCGSGILKFSRRHVVWLVASS
jgi:hypothetical protein